MLSCASGLEREGGRKLNAWLALVSSCLVPLRSKPEYLSETLATAVTLPARWLFIEELSAVCQNNLHPPH
jgi:hypothetical protein